jgi:hypothetical protein
VEPSFIPIQAPLASLNRKAHKTGGGRQAGHPRARPVPGQLGSGYLWQAVDEASVAEPVAFVFGFS